MQTVLARVVWQSFRLSHNYSTFFIKKFGVLMCFLKMFVQLIVFLAGITWQISANLSSNLNIAKRGGIKCEINNFQKTNFYSCTSFFSIQLFVMLWVLTAPLKIILVQWMLSFTPLLPFDTHMRFTVLICYISVHIYSLWVFLSCLN